MTTNDEGSDFARLWQTEGTDDVVDAIPMPDLDALVGGAATRRRRGFVPVLGSAVVLAVSLAWYAAAMTTGLLQAPRFMIVSAHALLVSAAAAFMFAAITRRLATRVLTAGAATDDVVERHTAPLLSSVRRAQWATAFVLLVAVHLALLSILLVVFAGSLDFVVVACAVVVSLSMSWWQLETLSTPLQRLQADMRHAVDADARPVQEHPSSAAMPGASAIPSPTTSTPSTRSSSSPIIPGAVPGSSAAMSSSRHFDAAPSTSMGLLNDRERRSWRAVVALVAVAVVPLLIDALAVLGLQWGPQPTVSDFGLTVEVPLLHRVLPYLPIVVALIGSVLTPLAFLVGRDVVDRRFVGRFTWVALVPLLGVPAVLSALGLSLGDDLNAHLWGYSLTSQVVASVVDGSCTEECLTFFIFTCIASVGRLLRFIAVVVVAMGLRRLVGAGTLRTAVIVVLTLQVTAWAATAWLPVPDAWRGLVDVVVGVALLLIAVLSQPVFEADQQ